MAKKIVLNMYKGILSNKNLGYGARIVLCAIKSNVKANKNNVELNLENTLELDDLRVIVGESTNSISSHLYRLRKEGVYLVNNLDEKLPLDKHAIIPTQLLLSEMESWTKPCLLKRIMNWFSK